MQPENVDVNSAHTPYEIDIKGIKLEIDKDVNEICETSNSTSSSTRSVMYILAIACILSFIATLNNRSETWPNSRMNKLNEQIVSLELSLNRAKKEKQDSSIQQSLQDSIDFRKKLVEISERNRVENFQTVKMPILGNAFDVNNLGTISGITLFILLAILFFTIKREINNLRIAFRSITERYQDNSDEKLFEIQNEKKEDKDFIRERLNKINYVRRKHHYNFLSMNEVFNLPPSSIKDEKILKDNIKNFLFSPVNYVFFIPSVAYFFILRNDIRTYEFGYRWNHTLTNESIFISLVAFFAILYFSFICTVQKYRLYAAYEKFKNNNYKLQYKQDVADIAKYNEIYKKSFIALSILLVVLLIFLIFFFPFTLKFLKLFL